MLSPPPWGRSSLWFLSWRLFTMTQSWLHRLLKRKSRPVSRTARKPFGRNRFVPKIEALGERIVPSVFHFTRVGRGQVPASPLRAPVEVTDARDYPAFGTLEAVRISCQYVHKV